MWLYKDDGLQFVLRSAAVVTSAICKQRLCRGFHMLDQDLGVEKPMSPVKRDFSSYLLS